MLRLLNTALFMASASPVAANEALTQRVKEALWQTVVGRCPETAPAFSRIAFDKSADEIAVKSVEGNENAAFMDYTLGLRERLGKKSIPSFHGISFVVIAGVQGDDVAEYHRFLKSGDMAGLSGLPEELRQASLHSTALLKCVMPTVDEAARFRDSDDKDYLLVAKAIDVVECKNWIAVSDAILALDVSKAGTPEMTEALSEIGKNVLGQCEVKVE